MSTTHLNEMNRHLERIANGIEELVKLQAQATENAAQTQPDITPGDAFNQAMESIKKQHPAVSIAMDLLNQQQLEAEKKEQS